MISALFLILGIHSTANLKPYQGVKNFFNPPNKQSLSGESLDEKRHKFIGMCSCFTWFNMKILNLCHRWQAYSQPSQISKMERFVKIVNGEKSLTIFTKCFILDVWQGFENLSEKHTSRFNRSSKCVFLWKPNVFYSFTNNSKSKQS